MKVQDWLGEDNKLGIDIWSKKYQYNNETFEDWVERVSGGNKDVATLIKQKKFLFGGRILSNRGLNKTGLKVTLSNCYVIEPPKDSIESIFDCAKKLARTYSYGGGCGVDLSGLAPRGAKVNNTAKETSGSVSFMDLYSLVTGLIGQNGRRGALMLSISCEHPDLEEFIGIKADLTKCTKANISVRITDKFMAAVKNKTKFILSFTREETGEVIEKEVDAYQIFHKLCEMNWDYAEPGMLFWDRIENWNILSCDDKFHYAGTNPCVSGDTLILTDKGYFPIIKLCDKEVNVWNGYEYSTVTPHITGHNQPMKKIYLSDGSVLNCTDYHKFILKDGSRVEAKNLTVGDKLVKCDFPVIPGDSEEDIDEKIAYTMGFFMGDGSEESNRERLSIKLYGEKRKLLKYLDAINVNYCKSFDGEFVEIPYIPILFNKHNVPSTTYSIKSRLDWLAGYLDSDGTIQSKEGSVSISSIDKEVLLKVKHMLNTLGCNAWVSKMYDETVKELPKNDGTGDYQEYTCQESYRLLISAYTMKKLIDLGLKTHRVCPIPNPNRDASRFIVVEKIEDNGVCETVYCFNEPKNHSGIFNGIITAQCAEEPLPAGGSCLLGSINLAEFIKNDKTFDFEDFKKSVDISIRALNEVLDEGLPLHPLKEQRDSVRDWRQTGLGIFGLADALIKMGIRYGSKESLEICDLIGYQMAYQAIKTSSKLAEEMGCYPKYDPEAVGQSVYFNTHTASTERDRILGYGLANSQLLTIAPTGSLSTMLGVSGGIEPIFANYYMRKTESLHGHDEYYKVYTPIVQKYIETHHLKDDTELPDYFITAQKLDYKERIAMQGTWQNHIDASISSTVNVPNDFTVEQVEDLYIKAWENGLKGVTIFRDGCARTGILTIDSKKEEKKETSVEVKESKLKRGMVIKVDNNTIGKERHLNTGCGTLHVSAFFNPVTGELLETYLSKGSKGGCQSNLSAVSRLISLSARAGVDVHTIVDQLESCLSCPSYAVRSAKYHDTSKGNACPSAVGHALLDMYQEMQNDLFDECEESDDEKEAKEAVKIIRAAVKEKSVKCPECGEDLRFEGGCNVCPSCGYTKCD